MLTIDAAILGAIVAHARRDHPDEACGIVAGPAGSHRPVRHVPMTNAARSMTFYEFDSLEYLRLWREMDDRDEEPVVIYHSHTATEAYPSRTDVSFAGWPESHYLLVSTRDPETAEIRSFRIVGGTVTEEPVHIVDAAGSGAPADAVASGAPADAAAAPRDGDPDAARNARFGESPTTNYLFGHSPTAVDYECRSGS